MEWMVGEEGGGGGGGDNNNKKYVELNQLVWLESAQPFQLLIWSGAVAHGATENNRSKLVGGRIRWENMPFID